MRATAGMGFNVVLAQPTFGFRLHILNISMIQHLFLINREREV
jgi:hypothetical protein